MEGGVTAEQLRTQLCDDALDMLALWIATQEYNPEDEQLVKFWADVFKRDPAAVLQKVEAAAENKLQRPPDRLSAFSEQPGSPTLLDVGPFAGGDPDYMDVDGAAAGGGDLLGGPDDFGGAARPKMTSAAAAAGGVSLYASLGCQVGRKVMRYWPQDAHKNKDRNPWFPAVATDYDETTGMHILTYQFGLAKEEKEEVNLGDLWEDHMQLTDDWLDLDKWYEDPKKRKRSAAVEKSAWLRRRYQERTGGALPPGMSRPKSAKSNRPSMSGASSGSMQY